MSGKTALEAPEWALVSAETHLPPASPVARQVTPRFIGHKPDPVPKRPIIVRNLR